MLSSSQADSVPNEPWDDEPITFIWTAGLTGLNLGHCGKPTQVSYSEGNSPGSFSDLYAVSRDSLGKGSFGEVYSCQHRTTDTMCVVKRVSKATVDDSYLEEHRDRDTFTLLLQISRRQGHANVVRYFDFLMGPATVFVIMEPLDGEELLDSIGRRSVTAGFCRDVARQGLSALEYIHSFRIMHRDVKINAFRFRDNGPKASLVLFDFGHCCRESNAKMNIVGTVLYIAPEVFSGSKHYTTKVDVWALGVVLYVILTKTLPFESQGPARAVSDQVLQAALSVSAVQTLPPLPLDLLKKLLVVKPSERLDAIAAVRHQWFSSFGSAGDADSAVLGAKGGSFQEFQASVKAAGAVSMPAPAKCSSFEMENNDDGNASSWHAETPLQEERRMIRRTSSFGAPRPSLERQELAQFALATIAEGETGVHHATRAKGLTFNEAVLTMIINCVGAGVVLFPKIMSDVGVLMAPLLCMICAFTCKECGVMLTAACSWAEETLQTPIRTYEELASFSFPLFKPVLLVTKNAAFLGFLIAYMQLVCDSITSFLPAGERKEWIEPVRFYIVLPSFCLLALIKDLKQLAQFSNLGVAAVILECGSIMIGGVFLMPENEPDYSLKPTVSEKELPGAMGKYIAIFLFSFAILGTVPSIRSQLETPSEMHAVLSRSFLILVLINCVVMGLGYLGFGTQSPDNVVVTIGEDMPVIGKIASSAVLVNVLLSSPLYIFCVMSVFEASGGGAIRTSMTFPNICFRISLMCLLCFIGDQLPYVGEIIGLVSSVFACCNNILFPAIFHFKARRKACTQAKHPYARVAKYYGAILVGICVLIFGFQGSLQTLLKKLHDDALKKQNQTAVTANVLASTGYRVIAN